MAALRSTCTNAAIETALPKPRPWDSHGTEISGTAPASVELTYFSDLSLEGSNWESLHDCPGWLRLHFHLLTKSHPDSSLGGRLDTSLDPAKTWNGENAGLLHLRCGESSQAFEETGAHLGLHLMLLGKSLDKSTLGHDFAGRRFHGLHRLHAL